jgi:L-amino acid N-acyltransferase YncA
VRLEPVGKERARALLAGRPEPGMAWEDGFPLDAMLESLRRAVQDPTGTIVFGPFYAYVIVRRSDGLAVGDAGFHGPPGADGDVEVGYALAPAARGAGLATESVGLLSRWALEQVDVRKVSARVDATNVASVRVLERLGFRADGPAGAYLRYVLRSGDPGAEGS